MKRLFTLAAAGIALLAAILVVRVVLGVIALVTELAVMGAVIFVVAATVAFALRLARRRRAA